MTVRQLIADRDRILESMHQAIDDVHVTVQSSRELVDRSRETIRRVQIMARGPWRPRVREGRPTTNSLPAPGSALCACRAAMHPYASPPDSGPGVCPTGPVNNL